MTMKHFFRTFCSLCMVLATVLAAPATAETLDEIYQLADTKQYGPAMRRLETFLAMHPKDAQARFLKGLILTEQKKQAQAIEVFKNLSEDFPDLPEPYNNLAVLHADRGQYEEARMALVRAVRTHPGYTTAHENLGDIYAKMAAQSYARAMDLNSGNDALRSKLKQIGKLFGSPPKMPKVLGSVEPTENKPIIRDVPPPTSSRKKPAFIPPPPSPPLDGGYPVPAFGYNTKKSESPTASQEPVKGISSRQQTRTDVELVVRQWALAWSSRDIKGYLSAYSQAFQVPAEFSGRSAWEKRRRQVIRRAGAIRVTLANLKVNLLNENRAQTTFQQNYWSRRYQDKVNKTLSLVKEGDTWKIVREYTDG